MQRRKTEGAFLVQLSDIVKMVLWRHQQDDITDPIVIGDAIYEEASDDLRAFMSRLQARQLARPGLRHAREVDASDRQLALPDFPLVQDRYPTVDGRGYIKRDLMSRDDWLANIHELRSKGGKLLDHAKQLEDWGTGRFGRGC